MRAMRAVPVAFTGSGEALRRNGRRDLLVNIVLGGLYTPVARRNAAAWLARHTTLDGTPLAHVPVAQSRWPAIVLVCAFLAVRVAAELGDGPPMPLVIACGVLLLPWLWATVTARSVDAIRWREWALSFAPRRREVYRACWPLLVLGAAWAAAEPRVAAAATEAPDLRMLAGVAIVAVIAFPLVALLAFNLRALRFTRTRVGGREVAWTARFPAYLRICIATALAVLATAVVPALLLRHALFGSVSLEGLPPAEALAVYAVAILLVLLLSVPARAWYEARVFVLTWNGLQVEGLLRVECALDVRAFVKMRIVQAWRTLYSLGRQHPQSVVETYRTKLAALTIRAA